MSFNTQQNRNQTKFELCATQQINNRNVIEEIQRRIDLLITRINGPTLKVDGCSRELPPKENVGVLGDLKEHLELEAAALSEIVNSLNILEELL